MTQSNETRSDDLSSQKMLAPSNAVLPSMAKEGQVQIPPVPPQITGPGKSLEWTVLGGDYVKWKGNHDPRRTGEVPAMLANPVPQSPGPEWDYQVLATSTRLW